MKRIVEVFFLSKLNMSKLSLIHSTQKAGPNTEIYGPRSEYGFLRTARRPIRTQDSSKPYNNIHLMCAPEGNSEFCFPESLNVPETKSRETLRLEGKQNSLFPEGVHIKCFVI